MLNQMFKRKWVNVVTEDCTEKSPNYAEQSQKKKNRFSVSESAYRFFFLSLLTWVKQI